MMQFSQQLFVGLSDFSRVAHFFTSILFLFLDFILDALKCTEKLCKIISLLLDSFMIPFGIEIELNPNILDTV